jgi:hypothetical protein
VKSLKKFGLNLSLKVWFEKSLKKKKTYLLTLSEPTNLSPAAAHATGSFFFSFSFADKPVPPVNLPPSPSFLLPLLCLARPGAAANPAAPGRLPLPFLPARVDQSRHIHSRFQSGRFPFLNPCPR